MLAADQRESMRTMFGEQMPGAAVPDGLLSEFKVAVARELGPHVSAILLDRLQGGAAIRVTQEELPDCGIILAADLLIHEPGGHLVDTRVDPELDAEAAAGQGVSALKLLVLWRGDEGAQGRAIETTEAFLAQCRNAGLPGIVEAIVRAPEDGGAWDREAAIVQAARELGHCSPDLYKAEVPYHGKAEPERIIDACEEISASIDCPWVVLSSGVSPDDFPTAVEAACTGGASGFLAGRAIWRDAVHPHDFTERLRDISVPRAKRLIEVVQTAGRPWHEVSPRLT